MSQAKVDQYKKEKANRKKTVAKERIKRRVATICGWAVVVVIVGWAGVSAYHIYEDSRPVETIYADTTDLDDYLERLEAHEHEGEGAEEATEESKEDSTEETTEATTEE